MIPSILTVHIAKFNCYGSSRVMMQSGWEESTLFFHPIRKNNHESKISEQKLGVVSLIQFLITAKQNCRLVFHAQSSLPYLILSRIMLSIVKKDIHLTFDIHDLHEYQKFDGLLNHVRFGILRYYSLGILERIVFIDRTVGKITVSRGLSRIMAERYNCDQPKVVYNMSGNFNEERSSQNKQPKKCLLFFGTKNRLPLSIIPKLEKEGLELHIYGRDISLEWIRKKTDLKNTDIVKLFGEYDPSDMRFLQNYDVMLLYSPDIETLNYKYSMPNKLFQALKSGLTLIISKNFKEIIETFDEPGIIHILHESDSLKTIVERAHQLRSKIDVASVLKNRLNRIYEESRGNYLSQLNLASSS